MGTPVYGVRDDSIVLADEEAGVEKIGMVGSVGKVEKVIIGEIRSQFPRPSQVNPFLCFLYVVPFLGNPSF